VLSLDAAVDGSQVSLSHLVSEVMLSSVCMLKHKINELWCIMCCSLDAAVDGSQASLSHLLSEVVLCSVCMLEPKGSPIRIQKHWCTMFCSLDAAVNGSPVLLSHWASGRMWSGVVWIAGAV
jgi:hypothetical protein